MNDPKFVRVVAGPVGSGKSACCSNELVRLALAQAPNADGVRRTKALIVRNTYEQLRSTTYATFVSWFPDGVWGIWKVSDKTFTMKHTLPDGTKLHAEVMFMPMDTPDDIRRALSLELTFLWINEWRELHPEVVDGLLSRLRRFPKEGATRSCAIFDTNMPDMDTWHFDKMENPPENWSIYQQPPAILSYEEYVLQEGEEPDEESGVIGCNNTKFWVNPKADNLDHLDTQYYPGIIPGKTEDFTSVYLRCHYGRSLSGIPVFDKTFNPEFHIAKEPFTPLKSEQYPIVVGLDFGRTPSTVLLQRNVYGQLVVLDELVSENMGIETFLSTKLQPLLAETRYVGCHIVVAPDPAGWAKQQIGEVSPVDVVKKAGFRVVKPSTNDPERRIEAVERVLARHVDGKPAFVVNPHCSNTIRAFRYGYRYAVNRSGVQKDTPDKNRHSHIMDGTQYGVLVAETGAAGSLLTPKRREIVAPRVSAIAWT